MAQSLTPLQADFDAPPRLYDQLAHWWPLFSPPAHYIEEAHDLLPTLLGAPDAPPRTLLELGCGGGSVAYHLKAHLQLALSDRCARRTVPCVRTWTCIVAGSLRARSGRTGSRSAVFP